MNLKLTSSSIVLLLLGLMAVPTAVEAQFGRISGRVIDESTGVPGCQGQTSL